MKCDYYTYTILECFAKNKIKTQKVNFEDLFLKCNFLHIYILLKINVLIVK